MVSGVLLIVLVQTLMMLQLSADSLDTTHIVRIWRSIESMIDTERWYYHEYQRVSRMLNVGMALMYKTARTSLDHVSYKLF